MVVIEDGTIKGLNGTNVEIQTDDLIAFKDKLRNTSLDDAKEIIDFRS